MSVTCTYYTLAHALCCITPTIKILILLAQKSMFTHKKPVPVAGSWLLSLHVACYTVLQKLGLICLPIRWKTLIEQTDWWKETTCVVDIFFFFFSVKKKYSKIAFLIQKETLQFFYYRASEIQFSLSAQGSRDGKLPFRSFIYIIEQTCRKEGRGKNLKTDVFGLYFFIFISAVCTVAVLSKTALNSTKPVLLQS